MEKLFDTEHIYRTYFHISVPVVLSLIVSIIYSLTDTFFVARTGNTELIAGVSLCTPVFTALMAAGNIFDQGEAPLSRGCWVKETDTALKESVHSASTSPSLSA